jgi:di/tricarboxylate transporter
MDNKNLIYIAIGAVLLYLLFFRKPAATATTSALVPTGAGATPYSGYPAGYTPPASGQGAAGGAPQPIYQTSGDTTGATLAGVGSLIGGIGTATGSILAGLGSSGLLGGSSDGGGSYDTDY